MAKKSKGVDMIVVNSSDVDFYPVSVSSNNRKSIKEKFICMLGRIKSKISNKK